MCVATSGSTHFHPTPQLQSGCLPSPHTWVPAASHEPTAASGGGMAALWETAVVHSGPDGLDSRPALVRNEPPDGRSVTRPGSPLNPGKTWAGLSLDSRGSFAIPKDLRMLCHISTGPQDPQDPETGTQGIGMISRSHGVPQCCNADRSSVVPTSSQGQGPEPPSVIPSY